jgi:2-polyprenyl-3-methyl-5-hydroxy-6-metoxy-1,4-benzoquinol methylase
MTTARQQTALRGLARPSSYGTEMWMDKFRPIGDFVSVLHERRWTRWAVRTLGIVDLHSHTRLRPLLAYFSDLQIQRPIRVLEVGCGNGVNLFELYRRRRVRAIGYDLSDSAIDEAKYINEMCFHSAIEFHNKDVRDDFSVADRHDCVLCMDILEHLEEPRRLLDALDPTLRPGGVVLVSVPTPRYVEVFGREFNTSIGHVVDGYTLAMLDGVMPPTFQRVDHRYSTGRLASVGCALYYRAAMQIERKEIRLAAHLLLLALFKWFDPFNSPQSSCSLFAVYEKSPESGELGASGA